MHWAEAVQSSLYLASATWSSWRSGHCTCECNCSSRPDDRVLSILEHQLERCGPERLGPPPAVAGVSSWVVCLLFGLISAARGFAVAWWALRRAPSAPAAALPLATSEVRDTSPQSARVGALAPSTKKALIYG